MPFVILILDARCEICDPDMVKGLCFNLQRPSVSEYLFILSLIFAAVALQ